MGSLLIQRLRASGIARASVPLVVLQVLVSSNAAGSTAVSHHDGEIIPWNEVGIRAVEQYHGDGLAVLTTGTGAQIKCVFQKIEGEVTTTGLWLVSNDEIETSDRFQVKAIAVGRAVNESSVENQAAKRLVRLGTVAATGQRVQFIRPDVVEEYSVSADGVRQDFIVLERPKGHRALRVELSVEGAIAEALGNGALLLLAGPGREIAYGRLQVIDAQGRALDARLDVTGPTRLAVVVDDTEAAYPIRIDPTFSDADWISMGTAPGLNGSVRAAANDGSGNLYVGGEFTAFGDLPLSRIAKWDGSSWSPLGSGVNDWVNTLEVSGSDLYVGGFFTAAGGHSVNRIVKWELGGISDASWSALGSGVEGQSVRDLAILDGHLYVAGEFVAAGGTAASNIARWVIGGSTNASWSTLGSGMNSPARTLTVYGTDLYVGGQFTTAGGVAANRIAKWSGSDWSALGSGLNGGVITLVVGGAYLYVGGGFTTAGVTPANNIARWELGGTTDASWSALGSGVGSAVWALAISEVDLYVGGFFLSAGGSPASRIAKWVLGGSTDASWSALGSGVNSQVTVLAVYGTYLCVGGGIGGLTTAGGTAAHNIAKWQLGGTSDASWSALGSQTGSGLNGFVYALALSGTDLYLGGSFTTAGGIAANHIVKWDGSSWSALGTGVNNGVLALAVSGSDLYAGGAFTTAGGTPANNIAKWSLGGTSDASWSALGSGVNSAVRALVSSGSGLYVGGAGTAGGIAVNGIAKWAIGGNTDASWSALGSGVNGAVLALLVSGTDLYVGGAFTTAGGIAASNIAKWNGVTWSTLGSGVGGPTYALAGSDGDLYVGGYFTTAGGVAASNIAKWIFGGTSDASWSALGSGVNSAVRALTTTGSDLYLGGQFSTAGGVAASNIAKWVLGGSTDASWSALGSGVNDAVLSLAASSTDLFVGGGLTVAGGKVSSYASNAKLSPIPVELSRFAIE